MDLLQRAPRKIVFRVTETNCADTDGEWESVPSHTVLERLISRKRLRFKIELGQTGASFA
jgi:hypothetical protein